MLYVPLPFDTDVFLLCSLSPLRGEYLSDMSNVCSLKLISVSWFSIPCGKDSLNNVLSLTGMLLTNWFPTPFLWVEKTLLSSSDKSLNMLTGPRSMDWASWRNLSTDWSSLCWTENLESVKGLMGWLGGLWLATELTLDDVRAPLWKMTMIDKYIIRGPGKNNILQLQIRHFFPPKSTDMFLFLCENILCGTPWLLIRCFFSIQKYWYFSYFCMKTYVVGTH